MLCMNQGPMLLSLLLEITCTGLEVALLTSISLVTTKKFSKLISKTGKFVFLMIRPQGMKKKVTTTSRKGPSA